MSCQEVLSEEELATLNLNYPCVFSLVPHNSTTVDITTQGIHFVYPAQLTRYAISVIFNLVPSSVSLTAPLFLNETEDHHTTNKMVMVPPPPFSTTTSSSSCSSSSADAAPSSTSTCSSTSASQTKQNFLPGTMVVPQRWLESSTARRDMQNRRFRVEVKGEPLVAFSSSSSSTSSSLANNIAQKKHQQADARARLLKRMETDLFELDESWRKYRDAVRRENQQQHEQAHQKVGGSRGGREHNGAALPTMMPSSSKEIKETLLPPDPFDGIPLIDDVAVRNAALSRAEARKSPQLTTTTTTTTTKTAAAAATAVYSTSSSAMRELGGQQNLASGDKARIVITPDLVTKTRMMVGRISPAPVSTFSSSSSSSSSPSNNVNHKNNAQHFSGGVAPSVDAAMATATATATAARTIEPVNGGEYHRSMFLHSNPRAAILESEKHSSASTMGLVSSLPKESALRRMREQNSANATAAVSDPTKNTSDTNAMTAAASSPTTTKFMKPTQHGAATTTTTTNAFNSTFHSNNNYYNNNNNNNNNSSGSSSSSGSTTKVERDGNSGSLTGRRHSATVTSTSASTMMTTAMNSASSRVNPTTVTTATTATKTASGTNRILSPMPPSLTANANAKTSSSSASTTATTTGARPSLSSTTTTSSAAKPPTTIVTATSSSSSSSSSSSPPPSSSNFVSTADERLAKQLQKEESDRRVAADLALAQALQSQTTPNVRGTNSRLPPIRNNNNNSNDDNDGGDTFRARPGETDEEFARRLARQFGR